MLITFLTYLFLVLLYANVLYIIVFSFAGIFNKKRSDGAVNTFHKFAVFIPAYKGDDVIISTMYESFKQDYPRDKYDIIIIADSLKSITIGELKMQPVKVVEVKFENSTKAKSLNAAIQALSSEVYDYAVVLDIDNVMEDDFLLKLNQSLQNGQHIVQGHRVAKNLDSPYAILDAMSEEINNHIFRKGHYNLGLSAALIGSGMAMKYNWFVELMSTITAVGGFDKELEVAIISQGIKIDYLHHARVYDEKVQRSEVLKNQRRRWMSAQLNFLKKFFVPGVKKAIVDRNIDLLDKIYQFLMLPRILLLGALVIFSAGYFINYEYYLHFFVALQLYVLALLIATPKEFYKAKYLIALLYIPKGFWIMFTTLFKLKGANKKFIHTPHESTTTPK